MLSIGTRYYPNNLIKQIVADHLRVTSHDGELYRHAIMCVKNALHVAEQYTNRVIVASEVEINIVSDGSRTIELPTAPLTIADVTYRGADGTWTSISIEELRSDRRVIIEIPEIPTGSRVKITGQAGYDDVNVYSELLDENDSSLEIPGPIIQAVMLMAGTFFEFTADTLSGTIPAELPTSAKSLLHPYRIYPYGDL
jgi:hypothetical protein